MWPETIKRTPANRVGRFANAEAVIENSLVPLLVKYESICQKKEEKCREFFAGVADSERKKKHLQRLIDIRYFDEFWKFVEHSKIKFFSHEEEEAQTEDPLATLRGKWGGG